MSNPTTSPTRAELIAWVDGALRSAFYAGAGEDAKCDDRTQQFCHDVVSESIDSLRQFLAAPSPGDALRQQIEALPRYTPVYDLDYKCAEVVQHPTGEYLKRSDVLALLSRGEAAPPVAAAPAPPVVTCWYCTTPACGWNGETPNRREGYELCPLCSGNVQSGKRWCDTCRSWRHTQPCGRDDCPAPPTPAAGAAGEPT